MTTETINKIKEEVQKLIAAPSCSAEAKAAGEKWLAAADTDNVNAETAALKAELSADIMPIDGLIAFAGSEAGVKVFGSEMAANCLAHAKEIKAAGARFCDCPACAACANILKLIG